MQSSERPRPLTVWIGLAVPAALVLTIGAATHADDSRATTALPRPETELNNLGVTAARARRFEQGVSLLRQALALAPGDAEITNNLAGVLFDWATQLEREGAVDRAITALQEALEHDPDNGPALVRLGNLSYVLQNDLAQAVHLWKRAHGNLSAAQRRTISQRIVQAERDLAIERAFTSLKTTHFQIRFEGAEYREQAVSIGTALEGAYVRLANALGTAPTMLTVILYTGGDFQRVAGRRDWALGLYDGRIRLRLDELKTEQIPQILAHELAHAFLAETYGPRIPIWIHEGFAQSQEPSQALSARQQQILSGVKAGTLWVPLKWLDRRFEQPADREDLERAYMEARWAVATLISRHGLNRFEAFLQALAKGAPVEQAFEETFATSHWSQFDHGIVDD